MRLDLPLVDRVTPVQSLIDDLKGLSPDKSIL